ncbi:Hypothetical protein NTJ_08247 [Nesidiocoris tenuis]|uniref:CULT domain-containing protein n=1 Tax=Nesidiocoris tenuis TaxID=355587 RepID=A0ABN7AU08_9HEMI|nr:Hypothetical protein NTJ_08247 [Nesidiocoris tenuis]
MYGEALFCVLLVVFSADSIDVSSTPPVKTPLPRSSDFLLCRHCGFNIASASTITNIKSPAALAEVNQTLFGLDGVLVQRLENPIGIGFDVVTGKGGTCIGSAQTWQSEHTWFPGHAWKACTCSRCSQLIGWVFEPLQTANSLRSYASTNGFYAFILDHVNSEKCT